MRWLTTFSAVVVVIVLVLTTALPSGAFLLSPTVHSKTGHRLFMSADALIVQNKGGGHGELGYQLAKNLMNNPKISSITILQDDACNYSKEPFRSYSSDLQPQVKVIHAPFRQDLTAEELQNKYLERQKFDYIWDNASQNAQGSGKAIVDMAKTWGVKLLVYVSSAGMYLPGPDGPFPMPETTPVKSSAGQNLYEQYAISQGLPLVSFRPQYIYGPKANKHDYLDWYFDRLVRSLPLPIPGDGEQLVSLSNAEDVAAILASPLNNEKAAMEQRFFNCGTDELVSYSDLAMFCAEAAGIPTEDVKLFSYDADRLGKGTFPFRPTSFYVTPDLAKEKLGWPGPQHNLVQDLEFYFESYKSRGGVNKQMSLVKDWEIVCGQFTPIPQYVMSMYEDYDPIIFDTSEVQ